MNSSFRLDRRTLIVGGASVGFVGAAALGVTLVAGRHGHSAHSSNARDYPTGPLAGRPMAGLYAAFTGYSGKGNLPHTIRIDWAERMDRLWEMKVSRSHGNPVVRETAAALTREYRTEDPGRTDLHTYRSLADAQAVRMYGALDFRKVGELYLRDRTGAVNERKLGLLRHAMHALDGDLLTAYGMTELLPLDIGAYNRNFVDFVLRYAGRRFYESIPALYDPTTSFGPYQFTSHALFDANGHCEGASKMNRAVASDCRIPGSVVKLRGDAHFQAAFLFAGHNLAELIRHCDERELDAFERVWHERWETVGEFIATAHHLPGYAYQDARRWLSAVADGKKLPFRAYCTRGLALYADKTTNNLRSL